MPFARPTLTQLRTSIRADIASAIPGTDALLRYSNLGILGDVMAALANGQFGYLDYIAREALPFTATGENLEGWAALKGVLRKPASPATGTLTFVGTTGSVIPSGTPISRGDGAAYASTADALVTLGTAQVPIAATAAGADGNAPAGTPFTLASGVGGVQSTGAATTALTGGADVEDDDSLRSRMLQTYAAPPQGGAATDYAEWTLAVPGVTRCWIRPGGMGAGTVIVYFMMDAAEAGNAGFPQGTNGVSARDPRAVSATGDQLAVAEALFDLQPVTALVYAVAPTVNTITLSIAGLPGASPALKQAISAAVSVALTNNAVPGGVTYVSAIEAAISAVAGSAGFVIALVTASAGTIGPGLAGNISSAGGALPVLGTISWL